MKSIKLTQGKVAIVDDLDFDQLSQHKWYALRNGRRWYAARVVLMHQELNGPRSDHRDGDGLNNVRSNLRSATRRQNAQGFQRKKKGCSSKYRGVSWNAATEKWRVVITVDGTQLYLGTYKDEEEAARTYDAAARQHFGEFASPNFV